MRIRNAVTALSCAALFSVMGAGASNAAPLDSFDNGWYNNTGLTAGVQNINVGWNSVTGNTYRNWLAFNLASFAGQNITSATLTFYGGNGTYGGTHPSETLGLFDYTGSINNLVGNQSSAAIYNDLGTGASYGTATVTGPLQQFSVTLTQAAINAMIAAANNASDQRFVIGGSLTSVALVHDGDNWYTDGSLFSIFGPQRALDHAAFLSVEVAQTPLPAALPLFASVLGGAGFVAWRRRRKAAAAVAVAA